MPEFHYKSALLSLHTSNKELEIDDKLLLRSHRVHVYTVIPGVLYVPFFIVYRLRPEADESDCTRYVRRWGKKFALAFGRSGRVTYG